MKRLAVAMVMLGAVTATRPASAEVDARPPVATDPQHVALEDVIASVLAHHPLLRAAGQEPAIAEADLLSARGAFDPVLRARGTVVPFGPYPNERVEVVAEQPTPLWGTRVFGGWRLGRGSFALYDGKYETGSYGEDRVGIQVPLWRDGPIDKRRAGIARAEAARGGADASVEQQRLELVRAASYRYWDWASAGVRLDIARELLEAAVARDAALAARAERGDIPAFERRENTRGVEQRRAAVVAAERALRSSAIELGLFHRDASGEPLILGEHARPKSLPEPATETSQRGAEDVALAQRPELRRLETLRAQARIDRDLAENQRKLGVDVSAAASKDFGTWVAKLLQPELEVGVLVDVPLVTRAQDGRVRAAEAMLARTVEQTRFARDRIVADVRDAASAVELALERLAAVRREIDASRGLVAGEMQRFELGEGTLLLVNLREQALGEARRREVDALADYHRAVAARRAALGARPSARR